MGRSGLSKMNTVLVKGGDIAQEIKDGLKAKVIASGLQPRLAVILVGEDEESRHYVGMKQKAVVAIGGDCEVFNVPSNTSAQELLARIEELNRDPGINGILVQLPLPGKLEERQNDVLASVSIAKDVDGFHPFNQGQLFTASARFISCAALACMEMVDRHIQVKERHAVLIGNSFDLIQPLALMLIAKGSRVQVIPDVRGWEAAARGADLLVVEKGQPRMVTGDHVKPGAFVIDAGFYWEAGRVCGNVDTESVTGRAGWLAPVPGGMGPILIAKLLENLVKATQMSG